MTKTIKIKCTGAGTFPLDRFLDFQGNLKVLSEVNYEKLKTAILTLGFSEPVSLWDNYGERCFLLNGHQRIATLKRMREEGYIIPEIPYSLIEADNDREAKKKLLSLTSQFGQMTQEGLIQFCEINEFNIEDVMKEFNFPDVPKISIPSMTPLNKDTPKGKDLEYFLELEFETKEDQTIAHEILMSQGYKVKSVTVDTKKKSK